MRTLVIAPHPDDEVLGVGGTILKRRAQGCDIGLVIVTKMTESQDWPGDAIAKKETQISKIVDRLGIEKRNFYQLDFKTTLLDRYPLSEIISQVSKAVNSFKPDDVFVPFFHDAHSDHRIVSEAAFAALKPFRNPNLKRVFSYEVVSETESRFNSPRAFRPNYFVDVEQYLEQKYELMAIYESEMGEYPFPRSRESIEALSRVRATQAGQQASEAFELAFCKES